MSADKRSVSTDALATLGTIIEDGGRDAIHLAVEPIEAGCTLYPGQHIGITGGKAHSMAAKKLGIVDPFLTGPVHPGQKFWLIVYPRQITSLRHVWEHPDFDKETLNQIDPKEYSKKWMKDWAIKHMSNNYYGDGRLSDEEAFNYAIDAGRENHIGPHEDARDYINDEWWDHWENITGSKGNRGEYFSCSC